MDVWMIWFTYTASHRSRQFVPGDRIPWAQKLRSPPLRIQYYPWFSLLKPGVGQTTSIHALSTLKKKKSFLMSALLVHSNSFHPHPYPQIPLKETSQNMLCSTGWRDQSINPWHQTFCVKIHLWFYIEFLNWVLWVTISGTGFTKHR